MRSGDRLFSMALEPSKIEPQPQRGVRVLSSALENRSVTFFLPEAGLRKEALAARPRIGSLRVQPEPPASPQVELSQDPFHA